MNNSGYPGFNPYEGYDANYKDNGGVGARFALDALASPPIDVESTEIEALRLKGDERIVVVGAGDGGLLQSLWLEHNHRRGSLVGVEPNRIGDCMTDLTTIEPDLLQKAITSRPMSAADAGLIKWAYEVDDRDQDNFIDACLEALIEQPERPSITMLKGTANAIPLPDDAADVMFGNGVYYHVPQDQQDDAMREAKRVLTPDGVLVVMTSTANHKKNRKQLIDEQADELGIIGAVPMNTGFTAERAAIVLPRHFDYVHRHLLAASFIIDKTDIKGGDGYKLEAYLADIRGQRDQFYPIPGEKKFNDKLRGLVRLLILGEIDNNHEFVEPIEREIFICSDRELENLPSTFSRVFESE